MGRGSFGSGLKFLGLQNTQRNLSQQSAPSIDSAENLDGWLLASLDAGGQGCSFLVGSFFIVAESGSHS